MMPLAIALISTTTRSPSSGLNADMSLRSTPCTERTCAPASYAPTSATITGGELTAKAPDTLRAKLMALLRPELFEQVESTAFIRPPAVIGWSKTATAGPGVADTRAVKPLGVEKVALPATKP